MMENDDLLVDEPGFDAEKIDAISQLSPMNIQQTNGEALHGPQDMDMDRAEQEHARIDPPAENQTIAKGLLKKKFAHTSEVKGARASKKLVAHRGRSSPKKTKGSGMAPKPSTQKLPRHEVFPSTVSKKILSLSGSVVSQKPPSKKI